MTLFSGLLAETWAEAAFACALINGQASTLLTDLAYHWPPGGVLIVR
jgi:hypothetical protein